MTARDLSGHRWTRAVAKRIPTVVSPHNRVDISGQEQTEFPAPGGKTGGANLPTTRH